MQGRRDKRDMDAGGRLGGAKKQHRNNFRPPWKDSRGKLRGGGDRKIELRSRIQREVVM